MLGCWKHTQQRLYEMPHDVECQLLSSCVTQDLPAKGCACRQMHHVDGVRCGVVACLGLGDLLPEHIAVRNDNAMLQIPKPWLLRQTSCQLACLTLLTRS